MVEKDFLKSSMLLQLLMVSFSNDPSNQQINNHRSIQGFWWVVTCHPCSGSTSSFSAYVEDGFCMIWKNVYIRVN